MKANVISQTRNGELLQQDIKKPNKNAIRNDFKSWKVVNVF